MLSKVSLEQHNTQTILGVVPKSLQTFFRKALFLITQPFTRTLVTLFKALLSTATMQPTAFLLSLLAASPITLSAPTYSELYNCGYVLTVRNSSAYAGISAFGDCTAIYYNQSIPGYQDAYAYSLYGGCQCSFHL
jgi:hypothetical protein